MTKVFRWVETEAGGRHEETDWDWLKENYGDIAIKRSTAGGKVWRVVALYENQKDATHIAHLQDESGQPVAGVSTIWNYSSAPVLPDWGDVPPERWFENGDHGETNGNGDIGWAMSGGGYYFVPGGGPYNLWVGELYVPSDCLCNLGMLGLTNHFHMDSVWQRVEGESEPEPEPPEQEDWAALWMALNGMQEQLDRIEAQLKRGFMLGPFKISPVEEE